mmetsp:Transcript_46868/g.75543  ORF Transcript_46868/g.75543 Transcript_46868/m.75543 type:complete len:210 (-) Transcript_46868:450-1079(-)
MLVKTARIVSALLCLIYPACLLGGVTLPNPALLRPLVFPAPTARLVLSISTPTTTITLLAQGANQTMQYLHILIVGTPAGRSHHGVLFLPFFQLLEPSGDSGKLLVLGLLVRSACCPLLVKSRPASRKVPALFLEPQTFARRTRETSRRQRLAHIRNKTCPFCLLFAHGVFEKTNLLALRLELVGLDLDMMLETVCAIPFWQLADWAVH